MSTQPVTLSEDQLRVLAAAIVDEQEARQDFGAVAGTRPETVLIDATTLAGKLGISRSTVYEHSAELGAVEVGNGDRPRLRFDPEKALEAWTRREAGRRSQEPVSPAPARVSRRRRSPSLGSSGFLLPVLDRGASPDAGLRGPGPTRVHQPEGS